MKKTHILNIIFVVLIITFSLLRLYKLNQFPVSLFSDEVDIGYQVKSLRANLKDYQGNFLPLQLHSFSDTRTSSNYFTALVSFIPGVSVDLAIRLTPAIFSLLGIFALYLLTNSLFKLFGIYDKSTDIDPGLLSALLLSLTPWHFTYSRTGFELSQLFTFICFGLFFLSKFLQKGKTPSLILSLILLSLIPAIYNTAKLSVLLLPFLFFPLPGLKEKLYSTKALKLYLLILFLPLALLILTGGAGRRFSEIAIHTDPTLPTQTDFLRQADLGKNLVVGSSPSIISKLAHNKPLMIASSFVKNMIVPISTDFLFVKGDQNLRHAVPGWGMMLKTQLPLIIIGLFLLASRHKFSFLAFLGIFSLLSLAPSAITRDGATHSSRTFLLLLPLILSCAYGLYSLFSRRLVSLLIISFILFESALYLHDYFVHYPVLSERDFHAGLKELVSEANKYPGKTIVLTRTYEPSLIFFLYYTNFPPAKAQELIPQGKLTEGIEEDLNLEGVKVTGTNIYLASVRDSGAKDPLVLKDAIYVIPANQAAGFIAGKRAVKLSDIYLPSGELMYTVITPVKLPAPNAI